MTALAFQSVRLLFFGTPPWCRCFRRRPSALLTASDPQDAMSP